MISALAVALSLLPTATAPASAPCAVTSGHTAYTILVEPSGNIVHCRDGEETESEPLSHERVVLQLPPVRPDQPYRYRLVDAKGEAAQHHPKLFGRALSMASELADALRDLEGSSESVGEAVEHLEP
ncbi:MAG: hypothetical protein ACYCWW_19385, partial [Deltaproteobacteria bacterium]